MCSRRARSGEGLEWGTRGEGGEDGGELCRVGLLLLSVSKMSLEPPTLDSYFQNRSIRGRLGPFQRQDKLGNTAKSRVRQLTGISRLGPEAQILDGP